MSESPGEGRIAVTALVDDRKEKVEGLVRSALWTLIFEKHIPAVSALMAAGNVECVSGFQMIGSFDVTPVSNGSRGSASMMPMPPELKCKRFY